MGGIKRRIGRNKKRALDSLSNARGPNQETPIISIGSGWKREKNEIHKFPNENLGDPREGKRERLGSLKLRKGFNNKKKLGN